ncbi:MAG: hypothetical protein GY716_14370 [bacterium]|nr:hypothetical protein [bacterium]
MIRLVAALAAFVLVGGIAAGQAGDPDAARRQYRVARRLVAEGSPQAGAALAQVAQLDPEGPLADDALVELALLERPARWPEEIGRIDPQRAAHVLELLSGVVDGIPDADRGTEARYLRGLLLLEPLPLRDPAGARLDLITVATDHANSRWVAPARYAIAWLSQSMARLGRAEAALQRLVVDSGDDEAALRSRARLARMRLAEGEFGAAARGLDDLLRDASAPEIPGLDAHFELAVRNLAGADEHRFHHGRLQVRAQSTGVRQLAGMVATPEGGVVLADRRSGAIVRFDSNGAETGRWKVPSPQALSATVGGLLYVAAGTDVLRLDESGTPVVAGQGDLAPASALTVDEWGGLWILGRRGDRVDRVEPGAASGATWWQGAKLSAIVWDGLRLVGIDAKEKRLLELQRGGGTRPIGDLTFQRADGLTCDAARTLVVLDSRAQSVTLVAPDGSQTGQVATSTLGVQRAGGAAIGFDGALHLFGPGAGSWVSVP